MATSRQPDIENLTDPQRDWLLHSEALWREAQTITAANPGVDAQRLGRGLTRVRTRPHLG